MMASWWFSSVVAASLGVALVGCQQPGSGAAPPRASAAPPGAATEADSSADAASRRLFMLRLAQSVDDRCKMMPPEIRRDFDERVERLDRDLVRDAGAAAAAPLAGEARRRAEEQAQRCDAGTQRFLQDSVATARRLAS
jgi:hypothetical protein